MKPWIQCPGLYKPVFVAQNCDPRTYEAETGEAEVQGHPWLHSKFKASMNLSQKIKNKQNKQTEATTMKKIFYEKKCLLCCLHSLSLKMNLDLLNRRKHLNLNVIPYTNVLTLSSSASSHRMWSIACEGME